MRCWEAGIPAPPAPAPQWPCARTGSLRLVAGCAASQRAGRHVSGGHWGAVGGLWQRKGGQSHTFKGYWAGPGWMSQEKPDQSVAES